MIRPTAVEWLIDQLEEWGQGRIKWPTYLWEQAEKMEKEQMVRAFYAGCSGDYSIEEVREWAENYILSTYNKRNAPISEGIDQPGLPEGRE